MFLHRVTNGFLPAPQFQVGPEKNFCKSAVDLLTVDGERPEKKDHFPAA